MADEINVHVDPSAAAALGALSLDFRPFWPIAGGIMRGWLREQFQTQGGWGHSPWAPLSPGYAARKAFLRPGRPLLVFDGSLQRAVWAPVPTATATSYTLTIRDPKAAYHQAGTGRMPARPLIPDTIPPPALDELSAGAGRYLDDILRRFARVR